MFDIFDSLLAGSEVEFEGKKYIYVKSFSPKDDLILAVELGAELPAPVVVIKQPKSEANTGGKSDE